MHLGVHGFVAKESRRILYSSQHMLRYNVQWNAVVVILSPRYRDLIVDNHLEIVRGLPSVKESNRCTCHLFVLWHWSVHRVS